MLRMRRGSRCSSHVVGVGERSSPEVCAESCVALVRTSGCRRDRNSRTIRSFTVGTLEVIQDVVPPATVDPHGRHVTGL